MNKKSSGDWKKILKWGVSVFFLLATFIYFPSVASIFMALLGIWLLPIAPLQDRINGFVEAKWLKTAIGIALFLFAMWTVPNMPTENAEGLDISLSDTTSATTTETEASALSAPDASFETETEATEESTAATTETTVPATSEPTLPSDTIIDGSTFEVHFIDVGQADAALILCDGKTMLIDGGNSEDSNLIYSYLQKYNIDYIDVMIATHAHEDHVGGLSGALNYADVDTVYCPTDSYDSKAFSNFIKYVEKQGKTITIPTVGDVFQLGSASCQILAVNTDRNDTNNSSIVLRIDYGETSFLFTGDAEREVEQALLNSGYDISVTVLKVGHHGSDTSTSYVFLREIMPEYAVISVGSGNSYGHPTEEVLSRLRDADVKTYRTDMQGDIICTSDGKSVVFSVERNSDADVFNGIGANSTQQQSGGITTTTEPTSAETSVTDTEPTATESAGVGTTGTDSQGTTYVLNTNSKKFHYPYCGSVSNMSEKNKAYHTGTRDEVIAMGYDPCGNCHP